MSRLPVRMLVLVASLALLNAQRVSATPRSQSSPPVSMVRLQGHVLSALAKAKEVEGLESGTTANAPMTLTLVLNRSDQAGFERYLHDVYDSQSPSYRHFLTPLQISDRFGPSQNAYDAVLVYLQENDFTLVEGSANRLTLTVRGTRAQGSVGRARPEKGGDIL